MQSFTDALVKWFFDNFPMLVADADSFRAVSIHCVVRGLGASILYKCPASRSSFPSTARLSCLDWVYEDNDIKEGIDKIPHMVIMTSMPAVFPP